MTHRLALLAVLCAALLASPALRAGCVNPPGVNGETIYNADHGVMQFCDGASWISMAASGSATEVDPRVGTLENGKWCSSNGTIITCTEDAPVSGAGGSSGQVQYNDGIGLAGAAAVTYATSGDLLMLTSQAATDIPLIVKGAASQSGNLTEWRDSSDSARVVINNSGNVGIGTATPHSALEVVGTIRATSFRGTAGHWTLAEDASSNLIGNTWSTRYFKFNSATFAQNGNVGIGTTSPAYTLDINGSSYSVLRVKATQPNLVLDNGTNTGSLQMGTGGYTSLYLGSGTHALSTPAMAITTSETVHITKSPNLYGVEAGQLVINTPDDGSVGLNIIRHSNSPTGDAIFRVTRWNTPTTNPYIEFKDTGAAYFAGNVGIGTTTPYSALEVVGTIRATSFRGTAGHWTLAEDASSNLIGNTWSTRYFKFNGATFAQNGNVGIGTTAPGYKLDVAGIIRSNKPVYGDPDDENGYRLKIQDYGGTHNDAGFGIASDTGAMWINNVAGGSIYFNDGTNGPTVTIVGGSGNVGIGTVSPSYKLDVVGDVRSSTALRTLKFQASDEVAGVLQETTGYLRFANGDTETVRIDPSGNVGIGTVNPNAKLEVYGGGTGIIRITSSGSNYAGIDFYTTTTRKWSMYEADSNNNMYFLDAQQDNGAYMVQDNNGWFSFSDARMKKNVQTYEVLDRIDNYRAVSFDWKNNGKHDVGVIAQELYKVFPEIVDKGSDMGEINKIMDEGAWAVRYDRLGALALQAVKELKTENDNLRAMFEAANDNQAAALKALKAEMEALRTTRR